jgi:hypothetical protein
MKIPENAHCDRHPKMRMKPCVISYIFSGVDHSERALRCRLSRCHRCYLPDYGYFNAGNGRPPDYGDIDSKPQCGDNHELYYLFVEQTGPSEWRYSCPVESCNSHEPYP